MSGVASPTTDSPDTTIERGHRGGRQMVGVTTVVVTQPDWTRTLLTPLRAPAWRAYLYLVLVSVLAVAGVAFVFFAGLGSGLLMATLVGIPLLALVVMSGRAWNRLSRSLARLMGV